MFNQMYNVCCCVPNTLKIYHVYRFENKKLMLHHYTISIIIHHTIQQNHGMTREPVITYILQYHSVHILH